MKKIRTNVTLNEDVFKKAKKYNIIISSFLEIKLREYIALIEGKKVERPGWNLNPSPELDRLG